MASEDIKIVINADDRASGVLSSLSKNVGGLGVALTGLAKIAGVGLVAGFGAMTAAGVSAVRSFMEAEKEMVIANTALHNVSLSLEEMNKINKEVGETGVFSFKAVEEAMENAGKAAVKLGMDDEAASVAFAKLFQITHSVTEAQEELTLAMDLAAFSGRSLEEATKAITMVHAGGTRVLKEFGIQIADDATEADALAAVYEKVGGSAEAMANTTAGKLQVLSVSWENLKETIGGVLAEALGPFIDQLSTWAQDPATQEQLTRIAEGFAQFIKQMTPLVKEILPLFISLMKFSGEVILSVSNFLFKDLPNAIGTSIFWVQQMIDKLNSFIQKIEEALRKLRDFISSATSAPEGGTLNPFSSSFALPRPFATGGIVTTPTVGLIGEAGPEAVIPLNKMGSLGGVTINITGTFLSEDAADKLAEILTQRLKLQMRI